MISPTSRSLTPSNHHGPLLLSQDDLLQSVVDWIESSDPDIYDFDLVSNYPRRDLGVDSRSCTLEALGLLPAVTLFTKERCDSD